MTPTWLRELTDALADTDAPSRRMNWCAAWSRAAHAHYVAYGRCRKHDTRRQHFLRQMRATERSYVAANRTGQEC